MFFFFSRGGGGAQYVRRVRHSKFGVFWLDRMAKLMILREFAVTLFGDRFCSVGAGWAIWWFLKRKNSETGKFFFLRRNIGTVCVWVLNVPKNVWNDKTVKSGKAGIKFLGNFSLGWGGCFSLRIFFGGR